MEQENYNPYIGYVQLDVVFYDEESQKKLFFPAIHQLTSYVTGVTVSAINHNIATITVETETHEFDINVRIEDVTNTFNKIYAVLKEISSEANQYETNSNTD